MSATDGSAFWAICAGVSEMVVLDGSGRIVARAFPPVGPSSAGDLDPGRHLDDVTADTFVGCDVESWICDAAFTSTEFIAAYFGLTCAGRHSYRPVACTPLDLELMEHP